MNSDLPNRNQHRAAPEVQRLLAAAARHHNAGNFAAADAQYRDVLSHDPENPDALHLLGLLALQTGQFQAAAEFIGRAIIARPNDPELFINRCEAYRGLGRLEDALADCRKALALDSDEPAAHYAMGIVLLAQEQTGDAIGHLEKAIELEPVFVEARNSLAVALIQDDRVDEAIAHLERAIETQPEFAEAHGNLASALLRQDRTADAEARYARAIELDPEFSEALFNFGCLLRTQRRFPEAAQQLDRALQLEPNNPDIALAMAQTLVDLESMDEAEPLLRKIISVRPKDAETLVWLGHCLQSQGRFDEARDCFEAAVAAEPDYAMAHFHLAKLNKDSVDVGEVERLERLLIESELPDWDAATMHYALASLCERLDQTGRAFDHYRKANELRGGAAAFDAEERARYFAQLKGVYTPALIERKREIGSESEIPVFILGMPRSGTTLTEQILASHPSVAGAGELRAMAHAVQALPNIVGSGRPYPDCAADLNADSAQKITQAYLEQLREASSDAARITDKLPNNFQRIGFIHLIFPRARIIHCRRDPLDTCLSCYFQNFSEGQFFSYDLANLGRYYRLYEDLMQHWHEVLPGRILDVEYESLVQDLEGQSRRIVEHCGLEWDDRCLDFHKTERKITTSSYHQVRQPLYTSSVGRWRRYEAHLGPLKEALGV